MFSVFSYVVHIFGMIPSTLHCVLQNDHSVRCMKTYMYLRSTMGQQRVSNIALINIETYMGSLQSTMTWIVSLISSAVKMVKTAINVFFELMRQIHIQEYFYFTCRPMLLHCVTLDCWNDLSPENEFSVFPVVFQVKKHP